MTTPGGSREALAVLLLATLVAWVGSWHVSLWTDESVTVSAAGRSWSQLADLLGNLDAVHAGYYALMKGWVALVGTDAALLRLPSALAAGGTAVGVLALARRVTSPGTALLAAVTCAVLPRMTWAGIEARPFVFSALLAVWATWALVAALDDGGRWRWVRYVVLAALGVVSNIYLVMLVMGHGVTVLVRHRERATVLAYAASATGVAVLTMPVLLLVRSQQGQLGGGASTSVVYLLRRVVVNQVFLGETPADGVYGRLFDLAWQGAALLAAAVAAAVVLVALLRSSRVGDDKRAVLALTLPWIVLPTVLVVAYAATVAPIYQPRYLTFTAPAAAVLLALGLRALTRRGVALAAAALLLACSATVYVSQRLEHSKAGMDWGGAAAVVEACARPGDAVVFVPRSLDTADQRSTRRIAVAYPGAFDDLTDLTLLRTGAETGTLDGSSAPLSAVVDDLVEPRAWVLSGRTTPTDVVDRDAAVLEAAGYEVVGEWRGPHTTVREYAAAGSPEAAAPALPDCA